MQCRQLWIIYSIDAKLLQGCCLRQKIKWKPKLKDRNGYHSVGLCFVLLSDSIKCSYFFLCLHEYHHVGVIDDFHISHNALGMEANIRVLLIRNSSSHSSLVVNGLEFPCLAATLCLYKTMVTKVVCSWAVDAKINISQTWTDSLLCDRKFNLFLTFLARGHKPKYFLKVCC